MQAQKEKLMVDPKYGTAEQVMALPEAKLVAVLEDSGADVYAKAKACQRLAVIGGANSTAALSKLLTDEKLSHYARTALEQIPDASASEALRSALSRTQGTLLVGVINSIGVRRDAKAISALSKLRLDANTAVARAADAALARIRPGL